MSQKSIKVLRKYTNFVKQGKPSASGKHKNKDKDNVIQK